MTEKNETFRYEQMVERSIKAQETSLAISQSLLRVSENLQTNIKELNDKFVLHSINTDSMYKEVQDIRNTFMKWLKVLATLLFIIVGGTSLLKVLSEVDLAALLKLF